MKDSKPWSALRERLQGAKDFVAGGAPPSAVADAERVLGVVFSEDYRRFVLEYGAAMVGPYEFVGIGTAEELSGDSVVELTKRLASDGWELSGDYVVSMDHAGNPVCINERGCVWTFDHDTGERIALSKNLAEHFSFLLRRWAV